MCSVDVNKIINSRINLIFVGTFHIKTFKNWYT